MRRILVLLMAAFTSGPAAARIRGSSTTAATGPARASTSSSSAATRSTAPRRRCRSSARSSPSITASSAPCCSPSTRRTARSTPTVTTTSPASRRSKTADLMVIFTRFRDLPDEQMKHIVDYVESGKPIIGLRTATHAFNIKPGQDLRASTRWQQQGLGRRLRPAGARRDLDQPPRPARHAEHARHHRPGRRRTTRSSAASRTATSGARPTSTASACPCPATASRWCWARCSTGMKPTDPPRRRASRTTR